MTPEEAKRLVMQREERAPINRVWLSKQIGVAHQSISQWFNGTEPRDPHVWVRIAAALSITGGTPDIVREARELAPLVLTDGSEVDAKTLASKIIREISEKTYG